MEHPKEKFAKYEPRACARCKKSHICTLTIHCPCFETEISDKTMDYLSFHFDDCLCPACLIELKKRSAK